MPELMAPLSLGELIDRLTILEIKYARIKLASKRKAIARELRALAIIAQPYLDAKPALRTLKRQLAQINRGLWACEAASRARLKRKGSNAAAAALLTRIAVGNDRRFRIKQQVSKLLRGGVVEQKSYL